MVYRNVKTGICKKNFPIDDKKWLQMKQHQLKWETHATRRDNKDIINILIFHTTLNKRVARKLHSIF